MKRPSEIIDVDNYKTTKKKKTARKANNQNLPNNTGAIKQPDNFYQKFYQNFGNSDTKEMRNTDNNSTNDKNNFPTPTAQIVIPTPSYLFQAPKDNNSTFFPSDGAYSIFESNQVNYPLQNHQRSVNNSIPFNMEATPYSSHSVRQTTETDKSTPLNEITSKSSSPAPDHPDKNKKEAENLSLLSLCSFVKGLFFCVDSKYSYNFLDFMKGHFSIDPVQARKREDFSFGVNEFFKNVGINIENDVTPKKILENISNYGLVDQSKRQSKWLITTEEEEITLNTMKGRNLNKLLTKDLSNEDRKKLLKDLIELHNQYLPQHRMVKYKENDQLDKPNISDSSLTLQ